MTALRPVPWWRVRQLVNAVNGSTLLGLGVALAGRARLRPGRNGVLLAEGYRLPIPDRPAFTIGDVVLTPHPDGWLEAHPRLLAHEERHAWQYAACLGLPFLPLYALASAWSWLRTRDPGRANAFEVLAGLADGGYPLR